MSATPIAIFVIMVMWHSGRAQTAYSSNDDVGLSPGRQRQSFQHRDRICTLTHSAMSRMGRAGLILIALVLNLANHSARADVVAIVSSKSAIITLSKSQTTDIFLGRVNRFPSGLPAMPIDQAEGSAAREEFYAKMAGKSAAQMKAYWSKIIFTGRGQPPKEVLNGVEVKKRILENPAAIGYIDANLVDDSVRVVQ
jgi:hypothetical protein